MTLTNLDSSEVQMIQETVIEPKSELSTGNVRRLRVLTDFPRMPGAWTSSGGLPIKTNVQFPDIRLSNFGEVIKTIRASDIIVINVDTVRVYRLVLLFWLLPFLKRPIIAVDLVLRRPETFLQRLTIHFKRLLLASVDHFIFYFKDLRSYQTIFGIPPSKCSYIPFKPNITAHRAVWEDNEAVSDGYVFTAGRSLRDFDTFFEAVARTGYPAAIPMPDFHELAKNGARFTRRLEDLPPNVTLLKDDGTQACWIRNLLKAKIVVIPTLRSSLCASGISTYLDAMILKKTVIISEGPGVSELLQGKAILIPPEDPDALVQALRQAWTDHRLRENIAQQGYAYASSLGGESELMARILECTASWYGQVS